MAAYQLTEDDVDASDDDPPVIRAARNPNTLVLTAVLNEGIRLLNKGGLNKSSITHNFSANTQITGAIHCLYNSPLVEAINARLPQNVEILLAAGADPNGIRLRDLDDYSVRFIRGRIPTYDSYMVECPPRSKVLDAMEAHYLDQLAPLTAREVSDRRKTFSRFWTEPVLPTTFFRATPARTALETASSVGDPALFDQVRAAQPDDSWWRIDPTPPQLPADLTHSTLCTSSPVHEAILAGKTDMLCYLLDLGYSPNILPLAAPTRCLPPLAAAIALCTPPNLEAYNILINHPMTNCALRTPVFSIHTLHFAAARLDLPLLQHISTSHPTMALGAASTTSLGHTLLHIVALPLTDDHINLFGPKIFSSIHDVRTLNAKRWAPNRLRIRHPANRTHRVLLPLCEETPEDREDARKQAEMVLWLLGSGTQDVGAPDVYGNTPLHYLASAMRVDEELVGQVRASRGGEEVWRESRNELGYTPEELWQDGRMAVREDWKTFWTVQ